MILASLSSFGANTYAIWEFAAGVLVVWATAVLVLMGVALIRRLIDQ
jgi:hypothetical protein